MKHDVFLSYRRKGGFETAKHLFDLLTNDGYRVCLDFDTLREGDFDKALLSRIDECPDFILIVDPNAFDRTVNPNSDPKNDWLRQEVAHALKQGKNIIPVLLDGASFPDNLPPDISQVAYKHGPSYSLEYFDSFYGKLKTFLHARSASKRKAWLFSVTGALVVAYALLFIFLPKGKPDANDSTVKTPVVEQPKPSNPELKQTDATTDAVKPVNTSAPVTNNTSSAASTPAASTSNVKTTNTTATTSTKSPASATSGNNTAVQKSETYNQVVTGTVDGYGYVDLGLSVMWATCNVGASKPSGSGTFFAWGEVSAKPEYTWPSYILLSSGTNKDNASFTKYNSDSNSGVVDNLHKLDAADDAASVMWSKKWRMPTKDEFEELVNGCSWRWTTIDGIDGYVVTSKKAGYENNSVFLPAAGYFQRNSVQNKGKRGCYWSSTLGTRSHSACYLGFSSSTFRTYNDERYIGRSVRPVYKK